MSLFICVCISVHVTLSVRTFAVCFCSPVCLSVHLSLSLLICLSRYISISVRQVTPSSLLTVRLSLSACLFMFIRPCLYLWRLSLSLSLSLSVSVCLSVCLSLSLNTPPPTSQVTVPLFYNCPRYLTMPYVCLLASRSSLGHVIRTIWHRAGSLSLPRELVLGRWCPLGGTGPPHDQSHNRASSAQVPNTSYQTDSKKVPHGSHSTVSTCCSSRRAR